MKLIVISLGLLMFFAAVVLAEQQTCTCIAPPGGECECRDNQYAVCKVRDGICKGTCYDIVAADDNRLAAVRVASNIFDVTPNALGYDVASRSFAKAESWQLGPLRNLMRQLVDALEKPPAPRIGYVIRFPPDDRPQWARIAKFDPGPEVRLAMSEQQATRVRLGARELSGTFALVRLAANEVPEKWSAIW